MTAFPQKAFKECQAVSDNGLFTGCIPSGAGLVPALSAVPFAEGVPAGIEAVFFAEGIKTYVIFADGKTYVSKNNKKFTEIASYGGEPFAFEYLIGGEAGMVICTGQTGIHYTSGKFSMLPLGVTLSCGVPRCGRLFAVDANDRYKLLWSCAGTVTDWEQGLDKGGYLMLDPKYGEVLDIVGYGEKLVLVRQYGLTVLNAFGSPENFSVELTVAASDGIIGKTAAVAGGKLLFYTESGLYSFDGSRVSAVEHRYKRGISGGVYAVEFAGRYFLACRSDALGRGVVLCYDTADGQSYLIDCAAEALCAADAVYCYSGGAVKKLKKGGWSYVSEKLAFGSGRNKTLTEISFTGTACVEVESGGKVRSFDSAQGRVLPRLRGKYFTVKITGTDEVKDITAKAEVSIGI